MSFLNELRSQADALQHSTQRQQQDLAASTAATEKACLAVWHYVSDLARQLNVIRPEGPAFSLDGKTPWPSMHLLDFRADARKQMLRNQNVHASIGLGWRIVPRHGEPVAAQVTVNFLPDLERVQARLTQSNLQYERKDLRHPETNKLQALRFEYQTALRGSVMVTPDHDRGELNFRLANTSGMELVTACYPAAQVDQGLLDEMAKLLVQHPSRFGRAL